MPIAYLDVPQGIQTEEKRKMLKRIYDALNEAYPFPPDHRVFLRELALGERESRWSVRVGTPETRLSHTRSAGGIR
jgi:hypothetical protein